MNEQIKQQIFEKIAAYDTVLIFRHTRMDGDCVGASLGLRALIRATWPEKRVLVIDSQQSEYLAFAGPADGEVPDEVYGVALGVVVDTANSDRISNKKYRLCREIVKIDHHIPVENYGVLNWVEEDRSSACEMIADFYASFSDTLKISREAATQIYMGMVTDSGRFRFEGVTGDTLRLAGMMLDQGVDTERLYARLYLEDFDMLTFKAYVYEHMQRTENGVVYLYIDREMQRKFGLTFESASSAISYLEGIKDCLCWLAFIEPAEGDPAIRVRVRSRFVTTNGISERFHGGGHAMASGATVYSREEALRLVEAADALLREYKETHTDWM
ncbi:MAG: bifunctional oligoribonuclease/PAP phosphatase NrnA [Clostridia bacterium]|nr:bifunctional oligoribonuclease/PAP phosphatase NrnA [Clostridia bacterium]